MIWIFLMEMKITGKYNNTVLVPISRAIISPIKPIFILWRKNVKWWKFIQTVAATRRKR